MNKVMDFHSGENKDFKEFKEEGKEYLKSNDKLDINEKKKEISMNLKEEKKLDSNRKLENKDQKTGNNLLEKVDEEINDTKNKHPENIDKEKEELQIQLENKQKNILSNNNDIYNMNNKLND